jgi:hypothetical protein
MWSKFKNLFGLETGDKSNEQMPVSPDKSVNPTTNEDTVVDTPKKKTKPSAFTQDDLPPSLYPSDNDGDEQVEETPEAARLRKSNRAFSKRVRSQLLDKQRAHILTSDKYADVLAYVSAKHTPMPTDLMNDPERKARARRYALLHGVREVAGKLYTFNMVRYVCCFGSSHSHCKIADHCYCCVQRGYEPMEKKRLRTKGGSLEIARKEVKIGSQDGQFRELVCLHRALVVISSTHTQPITLDDGTVVDLHTSAEEQFKTLQAQYSGITRYCP